MIATPHLTVSGVLLAGVVVWWLVASATVRTIEAVRSVRKFLRGE